MNLSWNTTADVIGDVSYPSSDNCLTTNKRSRGEYSKDSNSSNCASPAKRSRLQDYQSNGVSSSKFKGVVSQMNGHWGAQIYAKHQRIWLGTFRSEKEAAMAYDSAAIKLRNGDSSFRNFPWTSSTAQEPNFQSQFSTELVLSMIRDGSYPSKFAEYLHSKHQITDLEVGTTCILGTGPAKEEYSCRQLFQKELTPSDVGKLNRLVIPKKNALKYFSHASEGEKGENADDVQLVFYDTSMRLWKFRYCYWKSSQSYVFTRGWNKFVKEKGLKANDTVIFSLCRCNDGVNDVSSFGVIDVSYFSRLAQNTLVVRDIENSHAMLLDPEEDCEEQPPVLELGRYSDVTEDNEEANTVKDDVRVESVPAPKNGFRIFGVQIS